MEVTSSWLVVWRPSADVRAELDAAQRHAEDGFQSLEWRKVGRTKQNPWRSADFWMVTDEAVFGFAICARFHGAWKRGAKRRSSEGLDGQRGEDTVWWALMHILEEWAKKSHRKRKRTDDTPGPTPMKPTTSGPPGQPGPSAQPEAFTPDSAIRTPAADPTPAAYLSPRVRPPINASPPVRPAPVHPLPVRPPPMADTLGELFGGRLQSLDDHNPLAKWVAQSWPIWHLRTIYVANCVRYRNDDEDTLPILDFQWSHETIRRPRLQDVSLLGRPGARYIGLLYKSSGLPQSLPRERMFFIEQDEDVST